MSQYSSAKFDIFLQKLSSNAYTSVSLSDAANIAAGSGKRCLITFDDGMECVYYHALPLLEKYNQKSTIFCIAGFTGKTSSWDVFSGQRHLSTQQIRAISELNHEIGSHTCTHANLPFLNDNDLEKELKDSKNFLQDITGKPVHSLSFPYGSWNKRVWEKAREAGYKYATLYRNHNTSDQCLFPVYGVYQFNRPADVINLLQESSFSPVRTTATLMSHFSKGTPIVKFRKNYLLNIK